MRDYRIAIRTERFSMDPLTVILHSPDGKTICQSAINSAHARRVACSIMLLVQKRDPGCRIILDTSIPF